MTTPFLLGFLLNEEGQQYGCIYLAGTIDDYSDFGQGDVWNQEREMTREEFEDLVKMGFAKRF